MKKTLRHPYSLAHLRDPVEWDDMMCGPLSHKITAMTVNFTTVAERLTGKLYVNRWCCR